jgi:hypothetical protein
MSDYDPLRAIADRLIPLVQDNLEWWRKAVRRWASNPPRYDDDPVPDYSEIDDISGVPLVWQEREIVDVDGGLLSVPFPQDSLTPDERVTLLAAIHDYYADGVARIDPWRNLATLTNNAIRYGVLIADRVPKLRPTLGAPSREN